MAQVEKCIDVRGPATNVTARREFARRGPRERYERRVDQTSKTFASEVGGRSPSVPYRTGEGIAGRRQLLWPGAALSLIALSVIAYWRRLTWAAILLRGEALTLLAAGVLEKRRQETAPHAVAIEPPATPTKRLLGRRTRWLLKKEMAIPKKMFWR